jgi:hypothetical protein
MKTKLSWYLKSSDPMGLCIGPAGFKDRDWRELESVATPSDRLCNPFYVDAEMRCLLNRHEIPICYNSAKPAKGEVLYSNIILTIPSV